MTATTSDGMHEMRNAIRSVSNKAGEPRGGGNTLQATQNVWNGRKGNDCHNFRRYAGDEKRDKVC
jgi:hypothetical protein